MLNNLIYKSQNEILNNNPKEYYIIAYKEAEISYWESLVDMISLEIHSGEKTKCLDIGAAYGTLSVFCKLLNNDCEITVVDFVKYMSDELIDKYGIEYIIGNFEKEDMFENNKFDIVLLTEVLEHFNFNPIHTMKKISNILKEDGSLFLSTPNSAKWGRLSEYDSYNNMPNITDNIVIRDQHIYQYNYNEIVEILNHCGLEIVKMNDISSNNFNMQIKKKRNLHV